MNNFVIVIGVILAATGIACAIFLNGNVRKYKKTLVTFLVVAGLACVVAGQSFVIISTGYTGVRSTFGQIDKNTLQAGFHWKVPFAQTIETVNNKQQDISFENKVFGESSERTVVYAEDITVTYQINPEKSAYIYANVSNYEYNLVPEDLVNSSIKAAMVELDSNTVTKRGYVEPLAKEKVQENLNEKYGEDIVKVLKVVINGMDFEESYNLAIAEKQIAQQAYEKQVIENKTALEKAEADKKVAVMNAEAEAEAKLIEAEAEAKAKLVSAEAEAKANELLNAQLTENILMDKWIAKWDGILPKISTSENGGLIFSLPDNIIGDTEN